MTIHMTTTKQIKKEGTKTVWINKQEPKTEVITETQYNNIIDASPFMRRLGGSEHNVKSYTCRGYKVVRNTSTSPDKEKRTIRAFKFS